MTASVTIRHRGIVEYTKAYTDMREFSAARDSKTIDEIWVLEHPPVFTLGTNADSKHVLSTSNIPLVKTDRGGQVTYHGPGQLVVYTLIDIKRAKCGIKELVCQLERAVIAMLGDFEIEAVGKEGAPGVYVDGRKIASIGLRVRRHCSYHGIAINICADLTPFSAINPCGYPGLDVVNTAAIGGPQDIASAATDLVPHLVKALGYENAVTYR